MRFILLSSIFIVLSILRNTLAAPPGKSDVSKTTEETCPRFRTRHEGESLVIEIEKDKCEMVISSINMHKENADKIQSFKRRVKSVLKKVNVPSVTFRSLMTISEEGTRQNPNSATENKTSEPNPNNTETNLNSTESLTIDEVAAAVDKTPSIDSSVNTGLVDEAAKCTNTGFRFVGPVLVVDTVPAKCQMVIVAHKGKQGRKWLKRMNKKGKTKKNKQRKNISFEYIDWKLF